MLALIGEFRALEQKVRDVSNSKRERFRARKQLLPRERVALVVDPGAPWLELSTLAGFRMHDDDGAEGIQGGGGIAGIGYVSGIRCIVSANDSAIKGGTSTPMGVKKHLRIQQIALENKLPIVRLVESGGANLLYQAEMFVEGGRGFANQARFRLRAFRKSPSCTVHRRRAAPIFPDCRTTSSWCAAAPRCSWRVRRYCGPRPARSRPTRNSAAPRCTPPSRALANIWPKTMPTESASRARSWRSCRGTSSCRRRSTNPSRSRGTPPKSSPVSFRSTIGKPYDVREMIARVADDSDFLDFKG